MEVRLRMRLKSVSLKEGALLVGGYERVGMREDAAKALEAWRDFLRRRGVLLASSGGYRRVEENRGRGRAAVSWHNAGLAFDLYIWAGVVGKGLPYAVSLLTERGSHARFSVYGRVLVKGEVMVPRMTVWELIRVKRGDFETVQCEEPFVSITETARNFGFEPIPSRKGWRNEYLAMEWWHFNYVVPRPTTWVREMEKLGFSHRQLVQAVGREDLLETPL